MVSHGHCPMRRMPFLGILVVNIINKLLPYVNCCCSDFQFLEAENISTDTAPTIPFTSDLGEGLAKTWFIGTIVGLWWHLRIDCFSNKFPDDAELMIQALHFENHCSEE